MKISIDNRAGQGFSPDCTKVEWTSEYNSSSGILRFYTPVQDGLTLKEGYIVTLEDEVETLFKGYIFNASLTRDLVGATCYDQIRYLDYKGTDVYEDMSASRILQKIAGEVGLSLGKVEDTGVTLSRAVDNKKLIDVMKDALEQTFKATGVRYYLVDEGGRLSLTKRGSLSTGVLLGVDKRIISYNVQSSIERASNVVTFYQKDKKQGVYNVVEKRDGGAVAAWGALRYAELADEKLSKGQLSAMASQTLKALCTAEQSISLKAIGDSACRAGAVVNIQLEGLASGEMLITSARHVWHGMDYTMDLEVTNI